jgi:hypothetical protein
MDPRFKAAGNGKWDGGVTWFFMTVAIDRNPL